MSEVDERIARLQQLLAAGEADTDLIGHTLGMLRQLRAELDLVPAD